MSKNGAIFVRALQALLVVVFFLALPSSNLHVSAAYQSPGTPIGYVSDFGNMLGTPTVNALDARLKDFQDKTTIQIAVVTIPTLGDNDIESYATALFREWGVGTKATNNGILLLIARDDKKVKIEVGYGLEGALTDSTTAIKLIQNILVPSFRAGKYDDGVLKVVDAIIQTTQTEYTAAQVTNTSLRITKDELGAIFFFGIIALQWLAAILGRSRSWWLGGVLGGATGVALTYFDIFGISLTLGAALAAFLTFFGLIFDYIVSNSYERAMQAGLRAPWWSGGGAIGGGTAGWNSSASGGGFRGFSGGSSGGGGASGSW